MKRINSIPRTVFSILNKRAEILFAVPTNTPTLETQTESALLRLYATRVLGGDFVSSTLPCCRKRDYSNANTRQVL